MNRLEADPDTLCGIGSFKPQWMQKWATTKVFLVLHSIIGVISGAYYAYRIGVMTTLEKRFAFKSRTSGAIMMLDEITPLIFGVTIGYFGGKAHRPRLLGLGISMSALCCFVSAFPYLIYGPAKDLSSLVSVSNGTSTELCDGNPRTESCDSDDRPPTLPAIIFLMIAGILKGFGNLAYHSIGMSYMDDNAKKKNTPMYFAIAFALRLLGPLIGFLMSSVFLKYPENPNHVPEYGTEDPRWIGGWWMGFLLQGFLLVLITIPISLFPRRLPGQTINHDQAEDIGIWQNLAGMMSAFKRLMTNPLYLTIVLNMIMTIFGTVGLQIMLPKYMEHQFRLSASDASLYSGPAAIFAIMISIVTGGFLIWKFRPSPRVLISAMIVCETVRALGYLVLMLPKCEPLQMSNYGSDNDGLILMGECNRFCNCSTKTFSPVCGGDAATQYFSPCFAGCQQSLNSSFSDCSCDLDTAGLRGNVSDGYCVSEGCWSQAVAYIVTLPILELFVSLPRVAATIIGLRSVLPGDKSVALGTFEALICLFGFVPYLLILGSLIDSTCVVWEKSCGETGNCWFYDIERFNNLLHGTSAGFSALSAVTLVGVYFLRHRMSDLYEEDEDAGAKEKKKDNIVAPSGQGATEMQSY